MKLKNKTTHQVLRRRVKHSLVAGILFILFIVIAIMSIRRSHQDQAYSAHRYSFMLNEKLFSLLHSNKKQSVAKPTPPAGKPPRINGMLGLESKLETKNYQVKIESGSKKIMITPTDIKLLPKVGYTTDFRCIEGWSEVTQYAGARFSAFMEKFGVGKKTDGSFYQYVGLETPDKEYYVSIDMESMLHDQTLLAYEMNLSPLSTENGNPLRLVIPIKYGIKSLKRIGRIFFSDRRPPDYWAERGYDWFSGL